MAVEQRFVFDQVADLYDRARPRYPEPLFDDVLALSGVGTGARILEIGCGTGQASEPFARRGHRLLCLEPGAAMAERVRARLAGYPSVAVAQCTFEDWPLEPEAFDLVISAQAFHWVAPDVRFAKSASALRPGGWLAVFGNAVPTERSPLRDALDAAYLRHAPALFGPPESRWYSEQDAFVKLVADSRRFAPATAQSYPWSQVYSADEYLDLMRTHSNHRLLPEAQREALLAAIREAIERNGGRAEVRYEAHLYLARRAD